MHATQKPSSLQRTVSEKYKEIRPKITVFSRFGQQWVFLEVCLDFDFENILCKEPGFFAQHSVHQDTSFELSKTVFGELFRL